jgi:hypothetical protein
MRPLLDEIVDGVFRIERFAGEGRADGGCFMATVS